jgi:hypothetical protein
MAVSLDAFDEVPGRKVRRRSVNAYPAPRRWRTLDTVACERIARRRAQALLDDGKIIDAVLWLKYANAMMVQNNVARLVLAHAR